MNKKMELCTYKNKQRKLSICLNDTFRIELFGDLNRHLEGHIFPKYMGL